MLRLIAAALCCVLFTGQGRAAPTPLPKPRPVQAKHVELPTPTLGQLFLFAARTMREIDDALEQEVARALLDLQQAEELKAARAYLVKTATPGGTMTRDGVANNIAKLHPVFVLRSAKAIAEARKSGLPSAGLYSAYRAPAWGVGGFKDKANSLHSAGLAGDWAGVGRPGSKEAKLWSEIAGRHLLFNPYGWRHRKEWNHWQVVTIKLVAKDAPLRKTIGPKGPIVLERMWQVAETLIRNVPWAGPAQPVRRQYARRRRHVQVASR